jgi:nifR3 family TIM-barrel protein
MNRGFWAKLNKFIWAFAPMHDVTDTAFRQMIVKHGRPDVMLTEFVSVDGLTHQASREKMIWRYLRYTEKERPIVAQIWGTNPAKYYEVAQLIADLGFDGIDINMGCPEKSATKHGAGAALIDTPKLAQEIIKATKKGAGDLPVSVKTRLGYKKNIIQDWIKYLLDSAPVAITIHGRKATDLSKVPADWESIGQAVELARDSKSLILGNGDVLTIKDAEEKVKTYGVDGVMFGRAIFQNHWLFNKDNYKPTVQEKLQAMVEHAKLYEKTFPQRNFSVLKKHFKSYTAGIDGAKDLRLGLMATKNAEEVEGLVNLFFEKRLQH